MCSPELRPDKRHLLCLKVEHEQLPRHVVMPFKIVKKLKSRDKWHMPGLVTKGTVTKGTVTKVIVCSGSLGKGLSKRKEFYLFLSLMENTRRKPSPVTMYCSLMALNSCEKILLILNREQVLESMAFPGFARLKILQIFLIEQEHLFWEVRLTA